MKSGHSGNYTDYSKQKKTAFTSKRETEFDKRRLLDITIGLATVCYYGNDKWIGVKGQLLNGHGKAIIYANKLNECIMKNKLKFEGV